MQFKRFDPTSLRSSNIYISFGKFESLHVRRLWTKKETVCMVQRVGHIYVFSQKWFILFLWWVEKWSKWGGTLFSCTICADEKLFVDLKAKTIHPFWWIHDHLSRVLASRILHDKNGEKCSIRVGLKLDSCQIQYRACFIVAESQLSRRQLNVHSIHNVNARHQVSCAVEWWFDCAFCNSHLGHHTPLNHVLQCMNQC